MPLRHVADLILMTDYSPDESGTDMVGMAGYCAGALRTCIETGTAAHERRKATRQARRAMQRATTLFPNSGRAMNLTRRDLKALSTRQATALGKVNRGLEPVFTAARASPLPCCSVRPDTERGIGASEQSAVATGV